MKSTKALPSTARPRRLGRGNGTGQGKTSGRGQDGAQVRAAVTSRHPGKVGEDLPMIRRIPKRGFNNRFAQTVIALNVGDLSAVFSAGEEVTPETLQGTWDRQKAFRRDQDSR